PVLAVDIGGTKMAVGVVDPDGDLLVRNQVPTPGHRDGDELFAALAAALEALGWRDYEPDRCGVGCGGPMTRGGEAVSPINIPVWRGFPLRSRLAELTGLEVHVDNDAKALALGEGWKGAAAGCRDYLGMVVS